MGTKSCPQVLDGTELSPICVGSRPAFRRFSRQKNSTNTNEVVKESGEKDQ